MRGIRHPKAVRVPIVVQDHDLAGHFSTMIGAARERWPVRFGVPFPQGVLRDAGSLALRDATRRIPFQVQVTNRWPDGSVKWASVLALVNLRVSEARTLVLEASRASERKEWPLAHARSYESEQGFTVSNGEATIKTSRTLDSLVITRGDAVIASTPPSLELLIEDGEVHRPRWVSAGIETEGPLHTRLVYRGKYASAKGETSFDVEFGFEITAAQPWVECFHRLSHRVPGKPRLAVMRLAMEQRWELSDAHYVVRQTHRGEEWLPRDVSKQGRVEVRVASNRAFVSEMEMVGENVESYPPYLQKGLDSVEPWLAASGERHTVLFWTPEPLGNSPQTWSLEGSAMTIELIPSLAEPADFTQGRAKTHRWRWVFADTANVVEWAVPSRSSSEDGRPQRWAGDSPLYTLALRHTLQPMVSVDPDWTRACNVARLDRGLAYAPAAHPRFEGVLNHLFDLKWPTGMMNWGDDVDPGYTQTYAAMGLKKEGAIWTNNEYDFIYAAIHQMLRTGQGRFWRTIERAVQHALDVDFVHYSDDAWLHHGSPAHSANHTAAASYPSHIWTEGLLHYYYVSGDARALEVAKKSGDFILRYQDKRWWVFEETARESGWALLALTELYAATGERKFLDGGRRIRDFVVQGTAKRHPLFPGEASFFIGVLVMGLDKLHDHDPDARIPGTIDRILQWRLDHRFSPEGIPLYHWDASARMVNSREIMFPAALAIAHRHTRKKQYLEALWRCLQYWLDTNTFYGASLSTKSAASFYRTWIEALQQLATARLLSRLEFVKPSSRNTGRSK